jgi:L,D-transpeptidase YcbB
VTAGGAPSASRTAAAAQFPAGAAPPAGAVAARLEAAIEAARGRGPLTAGDVPLYAPDPVVDFYERRAFAPIWVEADGRAGARLDALQKALADAREHGLNPDAYHLAAIRERIWDPGRAAELELLATDAYVMHAQHRFAGVVDPRSVDAHWHLDGAESDVIASLGLVAEGHGVTFTLDALWPDAPEYWVLLAEKRRLEARRHSAGEAESHAAIPPGVLLRAGSRGPRVAALRTHLGVTGDDPETFDAALEDTVQAFQREQGLAVDGIVGPNTLELLNLGDAGRIARINVNLERWRWLPRPLPPTHVRVNIADFSLTVIDAHREVVRMGVIVGRPYRQTPVFTELMRYLVLNPDWTVPRRIAVQDKLPQLRRDAAALARQGFEACPTGCPAQMRPVDQYDWSGVTARNFDFQLRQQPGPDNALGRVKFILPNPYAVYLHDTPARELFARGTRAFSSGCIRLERALDLAEWVLRDQPEWTRERIDAVVDSGRTVTVLLRTPLPVIMLYFTAITDESGAVRLRPDLYQRDPDVAAALAEAPPALSAP